MKNILIIGVALIVVIASILGGIWYLDYMSVNDMNILCLNMKIEDVTENKDSSFVRKIKACKKTDLEDEKAQEDDELKLEPEGFEPAIKKGRRRIFNYRKGRGNDPGNCDKAFPFDGTEYRWAFVPYGGYQEGDGESFKPGYEFCKKIYRADKNTRFYQ